MRLSLPWLSSLTCSKITVIMGVGSIQELLTIFVLLYASLLLSGKKQKQNPLLVGDEF